MAMSRLMNFDLTALHSHIPEEWYILTEVERERFSQELINEVCAAHALYGLNLIAVAKRLKRDDYLFVDKECEVLKCFIVHLTWRVEITADWPSFTSYQSYEDFSKSWEDAYKN